MTMRKTLAAAVLIVFGALAYAGAESYLNNTEPTLDICEQALRQLSKGERAGFDVLFASAKSRDEEATARLERLVDSQIDTIRDWVDDLGELYGIDLVHIEEVGQVMRRYCYVCKYQRGWVRWRFTFYRPTSEWTFESYNFHGTEDVLFAECGHSVPLTDSGGLSVADRPSDKSSR